MRAAVSFGMRSRRWHGKDDARNLVWQAATRVMNPTISQEFIDEEYERDPVSADAEYGANFRSDIAAFVDLAVLEACTADGLFELPPVSGTAYVAFCDPSGGSSDSMTLAIAHHDDGVAVLDCVREVRAPFQPEAVVADFCMTLAAYGVAKVTGDRYAGEWPREQFSKAQCHLRSVREGEERHLPRHAAVIEFAANVNCSISAA